MLLCKITLEQTFENFLLVGLAWHSVGGIFPKVSLVVILHRQLCVELTSENFPASWACLPFDQHVSRTFLRVSLGAP